MLSFQSGLSCFCPQLCFLWWKDTGNASRVKVEMTAKHTVAGYVWWWPWHTLTMKEYHRQFPQLIWEKWDEKRCAMKIAELVNRYKSVVSPPHEKADSTHVTVKVYPFTRHIGNLRYTHGAVILACREFQSYTALERPLYSLKQPCDRSFGEDWLVYLENVCWMFFWGNHVC